MSYYPAADVPLTGNNQILQGTDWTRVFTAKDANGTAIDLSAYSSTPPRCQMRTTLAQADPPYFTPVCAWVNAALGQFRMTIANATSTAKGVGATVTGGVYQVEIVKNSDSTVERIQNGTWDMSPEVTR